MTKPEDVIAQELTKQIAAAMDRGENCCQEILNLLNYSEACLKRHQSESLLVRLFFQ